MSETRLFFDLAQGEIQETRCLSLAVNTSPGRGACRPTAGQGTEGMVYSR